MGNSQTPVFLDLFPRNSSFSDAKSPRSLGEDYFRWWSTTSYDSSGCRLGEYIRTPDFWSNISVFHQRGHPWIASIHDNSRTFMAYVTGKINSDDTLNIPGRPWRERSQDVYMHMEPIFMAICRKASSRPYLGLIEREKKQQQWTPCFYVGFFPWISTEIQEFLEKSHARKHQLPSGKLEWLWKITIFTETTHYFNDHFRQKMPRRAACFPSRSWVRRAAGRGTNQRWSKVCLRKGEEMDSQHGKLRKTWVTPNNWGNSLENILRLWQLLW